MRKKLKRLLGYADKTAKRELAAHRKTISRLVAGALRSGRPLTVRNRNALNNALAGMNDCAEVLDACSYLKAKVMKPSTDFDNIRLVRDFVGYKDRVRQAFSNARKRGHVYVAWKRVPEEFVYVGQARDHGRLTGNGHTKLGFASAKPATTLSLIFPRRSSKKTLDDIEGSLLALIKYTCEDRPTWLNEKNGAVPCEGKLAVGSRMLQEAARFLREASNGLHRLRTRKRTKPKHDERPKLPSLVVKTMSGMSADSAQPASPSIGASAT